MTTSVFIRNDSPHHEVFVGVREKGKEVVYPSTTAPLKPGESVTATVWSGNELVIREGG